MFMISASSALCTLGALYFELTTLIDSKNRIRTDRLDNREPALYRARDAFFHKCLKGLKSLKCWGERGSSEERQGLLDGQNGDGARNHGSVVS